MLDDFRTPYRSVLLATDLGPGLETPWLLALRVCLHPAARLLVLHAHAPGTPTDWDRLPDPQAILRRWGRQSDGWTVERRTAEGPPRKAVLAALAAEQPDLAIVGTHLPGWRARWVEPSVGEAVARQAHGATMVVPDGARLLVHPHTGDVQPLTVVLPIGNDPDAQRAVEQLVRLVTALDAAPPHLVMVHTGSAEDLPPIDLPVAWSREHERREAGNIVTHIVEVATRHRASLVAMVTHGRDSLADAVFGSTTEQVLREAGCPVLVVHR